MHRPRPIDSAATRRSASTRRRHERRVLAWGLLISAVLHALAIGWASHSLATTPPPSPRPGPLLIEPPRGLRMIAIRPIPAAQIAPPALPEPTPEPESEDAAGDRPAEGGREEAPDPPAEDRPRRVAEVEVPEGYEARPVDRTAAQRLSPRVVDPRLWAPMVILPEGASLDEVEARLGAAVELLGDSALAAAERAVRGQDWTVESESGKRWGISPGMLHLGDVKMPLPILFSVDPEAQAEREMWYDLQAQMDRARILESFEERVKAIRERRDRERAERRDGGG